MTIEERAEELAKDLNDSHCQCGWRHLYFPILATLQAHEADTHQWTINQLDILEADFNKRIEENNHPDVSEERMLGAIIFMQNFRDAIRALSQQKG